LNTIQKDQLKKAFGSVTEVIDVGLTARGEEPI